MEAGTLAWIKSFLVLVEFSPQIFHCLFRVSRPITANHESSFSCFARDVCILVCLCYSYGQVHAGYFVVLDERDHIGTEE